MPPLNPRALVPVPAPTDPSFTGPLLAFFKADRTCFFLTCLP